jgi:V-type H+-transporting ATPase subunit a
MGIFATFCGFCYNDYTSVPLYLFGPSCYTYTQGELTASLKDDCVYPIGVDPAWFMSSQELTFMNSLKMKIAVIFGVAQMSLGIFLKGTNALQQRNMIDFLFEFLPQIITLIALFGYMDLMIIIKWLTNWEGRESTAPSVIGTMIDMFLNMGRPTMATDSPLFSTWKEQTEIELTLLAIVGISVPAMLLVKPIFGLLTSGKKAHHHGADHGNKAKHGNDDDFKQVEMG